MNAEVAGKVMWTRRRRVERQWEKEQQSAIYSCMKASKLDLLKRKKGEIIARTL